MPDILNILFLAAEAYPFIKIGGLADVAGSLPFALRSLSENQTGGCFLDVKLVLPLHRKIQSEGLNLNPLINFIIPSNEGGINTRVYETSLNGVPTFFIDGVPISRSKNVYSSDPKEDQEKYTYFSLATLELARAFRWKVDIVHANDWHTALSIYAIRTIYKDNYYKNTSGLLTVHNLPYMGGDSSDVMQKFGFPNLNDGSIPNWARNQALPLGLWAADSIVPVSKTYAREILTPEYGCGLQDFLKSRADRITGIINGLDIELWDPEKDKFISSNYSVQNLAARLENKKSLLKKIDLSTPLDVPLIGLVSRIDHQKGIDLTIKALPIIADKQWSMVILGSGEESLENDLLDLQASFPDRVRVILGYDNLMSHLIYAGSDLFLMPSRYEPCGLSQMIAMRYGNVPVVHATGGLYDTVIEGKTGFVFIESNPESQAEAIIRALKVYNFQEKWSSFQRIGMKQDFSWTSSAIQYANLYRAVTLKKSLGGER